MRAPGGGHCWNNTACVHPQVMQILPHTRNLAICKESCNVQLQQVVQNAMNPEKCNRNKSRNMQLQ